MDRKVKRIGIIGGGPAGLFAYKRLVESGNTALHITVFEQKDQVGVGMPYSKEGANPEHVTNVSDNEVPTLVTDMETWLQSAPPELYAPYGIQPATFNEYKVVPRLLFGQYLSAQFALLKEAADSSGISTTFRTQTAVTDIVDSAEQGSVEVATEGGARVTFDAVIICTGHTWPTRHEGTVPGWFDSPYPPQKLAKIFNHPVAITGASLTAIDAVRTLSRANGTFSSAPDGSLKYELHKGSENFSIVLHSLSGLLPALRFHLDDPLLHRDNIISQEELYELKELHGGFIPLDVIFDRNFKKPLYRNEAAFYDIVKDMNMEEFVAHMMSLRKGIEAFALFKGEYAEAEKSMRRRQSVYWKEMLAVLSYAMNYAAKHLSAEDMMRLKKVLMPLVSIVIAFVPQSSYHELIALHDAGVLSLVPVSPESKVEPLPGGGAQYTYQDEGGSLQQVSYQVYINAIGQPPRMYEDFPFAGLRGAIAPAYLAFRAGEAGAAEEAAENPLVFRDSAGAYYLKVPGININDRFQVLDKWGAANERVYIMAVPYISGLNPDYSGLDFCEEASGRVAEAILEKTYLPELQEA